MFPPEWELNLGPHRLGRCLHYTVHLYFGPDFLRQGLAELLGLFSNEILLPQSPEKKGLYELFTRFLTTIWSIHYTNLVRSVLSNCHSIILRQFLIKGQYMFRKRKSNLVKINVQ